MPGPVPQGFSEAGRSTGNTVQQALPQRRGAGEKVFRVGKSTEKVAFHIDFFMHKCLAQRQLTALREQ